METNTNKTAVTLEQLLDAHRRSNKKIETVAKQVESAGTAGVKNIEDAMYQLGTCTKYTKAVDTELSMDTATVGSLLDDEALAALTAAGTDGEGNSQYAFLINGVQTGTYTKNTKLSDILAGISGSEEVGVNASYSAEAGKFVFTAKAAGADYDIEMGEGLADALFGPPADSDKSGENFASFYGFFGLRDGIRAKVHVIADGWGTQVTITNETTIQQVIDEVNNNTMGPQRYYFDRYTGRIEARDKDTGARLDTVIEDSAGTTCNPVQVPDYYTRGKNAVFTDIVINGDPAPVVGKQVRISVPTSVSQLENNSNFQTKAQVAATVAAASHLKRKKVASVDDIDPAAADADQYIYMVAKAGGKNGDKYDEYMVLDGEVEKVGDWAVDLSGFQEAEEGKGLSTNDFTNEDKAKLDGISFATDEEVTAALDAIYGAADEA